MKFKIKDEKKEKPEKEIELWLTEEGGVIYLKGNDGGTPIGDYIMSFRDGVFRRNTGIDLKGLKVDSSGRIKEKNGY